VNLPQIEPMKLSRIAAPFDHADFLFELKHDGFRCFAYIAAGRCDLVSPHTNYYQRFDSLKLSDLQDGKSSALQTEITQDAINKAERIIRQIDARWPSNVVPGKT
jgi:hypothetical protein